jgi:hypothetical protein
MSRRLNSILGVISILFLFQSHIAAQSENAIFRVQVLKSDGTTLREGTGFFMKGNHGYSHALLFENAASAQIITKDSTIHKVIKINGFDPTTGLTRMELDNMLSAKITKLIDGKEFPNEGSSLNILYSSGIQRVKTSSVKISKKTEFIGYGPAIETSHQLESEIFGATGIEQFW